MGRFKWYLYSFFHFLISITWKKYKYIKNMISCVRKVHETISKFNFSFRGPFVRKIIDEFYSFAIKTSWFTYFLEIIKLLAWMTFHTFLFGLRIFIVQVIYGVQLKKSPIALSGHSRDRIFCTPLEQVINHFNLVWILNFIYQRQVLFCHFFSL